MKKIALITVFAFLVFITTISGGAATPLEIQVSPEEIRTDIDTEALFQLTVKNNEAMPDNAEVKVNGPYPWWVTKSAFYLLMGAHSTKNVNITIFPTGDRRGRFAYDVSVSSQKWGIELTKTIYLDIPEPIVLHSFSAEKTGDRLEVSMEIEALKKREINIILDVRDGDGRLITTHPETLNIEGVETIERSIPLPEDLLMGTYTIDIKINSDVLDYDIEETREFEVPAVHDLVKTTKSISTLLYEEIVITFENRGNVAEEGYVVSQTYPANILTGFITEPTECYEEAENRVCNYVVERIRPGGTAQVSYRIEYWPVLAQYGVGILIVLIIIGLSFIHVTKPSINKRHTRGGKSRHSIIIEIKNPFRKHLSNVIVRDWVSPLAKVLHEEIEALKPIIRKSEAGTELIWKLGDIKPKEVRLLSYKIKTFVEGSLKMPRAYMRFKTDKDKRVKVYSRALVVS
jgi:hypothetical protein